MRKLKVQDAEIMKMALQQEIVRTEEARYDHRLHGVLLVCAGKSCYEVADLGHSPRTIQYWVERFEQSGFAGLEDQERKGRPATIDERIQRKIQEDLRQLPRDLDTNRTSGTENCFPITWPSSMTCNWACVSVNVFSICLVFVGVNHVQLSLRPTLKSNGHIKKLRRLAKRKDIDLWCEDECHFQQHGSRCAMWIPPENLDPVVLHAPTRKQVAIFGAVCPANGRMVTMPAETFDTQSFQIFLSRLLRRRRHGCKLVVVLDNARWHHAQALRPWLRKHRRVLRLNFLPSYSPNLNPVERVWKLTRRLCTHNVYFQTIQDLVTVIRIQFAKWVQHNLQLRRLCAII